MFWAFSMIKCGILVLILSTCFITVFLEVLQFHVESYMTGNCLKTPKCSIRVVKLPPLWDGAPSVSFFCPLIWPCPSDHFFLSFFPSFPPLLTSFKMDQVRTISDRICSGSQKSSAPIIFESGPKGLPRSEFWSRLAPSFAPSFQLIFEI